MSDGQNGISGAAIAAAFVGAVLAYSGIKGYGISGTFRQVLAGKSPFGQAQSSPIDTPVVPTVYAAGGVTPSGQPNTTINAEVDPSLVPLSQQGAIVVAYATAQLGKPYVFATSGPNTFDCSGLVAAAYQAAGKSIPHNSAAQYLAAPMHPTQAQLQPGDIIFYYRPIITHCALYVGNGQLIQASEPGVPIQQVPVYNNAANPIVGYGRF